MTRTPAIGASMGDAARARENDLPCCCDDCDEDPGTCGKSWIDCEEEQAEQAAVAEWEARREAYE
jgi:hypothetical protein